jgi:hypothetical protein
VRGCCRCVAACCRLVAALLPPCCRHPPVAHRPLPAGIGAGSDCGGTWLLAKCRQPCILLASQLAAGFTTG